MNAATTNSVAVSARLTCVRGGLGGCTALHRTAVWGSVLLARSRSCVVQPPKLDSMTHKRQGAHKAPQSSDDGACHRFHRWLAHACTEPDFKPDAGMQSRNASILSQTAVCLRQFPRYTHAASKEVRALQPGASRGLGRETSDRYAAFAFVAPFMAAQVGGSDACRFARAVPGLQTRLGCHPCFATRVAVNATAPYARPHMANILTLGTSAIREHDGLFSLNDIHAASGGEEKHRPQQFMRLDQTQALIAEIQSSNAQISAFKTKRGAHGGTYACRELVIAYAAWISAAFHLKVIRVFLNAQVQPPVAAPAPPKRNVIRCKVESVSVTMRLTSGGVGFGIRLQGDHYNMHRFTPGEAIELEYAQGATPLADLPIGVNRIAQNGRKAATA